MDTTSDLLSNLPALAAQAAPVFAYCLDKAGGGVIGKLTVEAGLALWAKVKGFFTDEVSKAAVKQLETDPTNVRAQKNVQSQLEWVLEDHPELASEVLEMLKKPEIAAFIGNTQTATATNGGKVVQNIGNDNKISIG